MTKIVIVITAWGRGSFCYIFGILPVCGARYLSSGNESPRYLSTAAQLYALPLSATGGGRARFPLAGTRRSCSNPFQFTQSKKQATKVTCFLMYERDGFTVTAIFASIYAVLKGFTLISTKA